jgi:hypothetical protein
MGCCPFGDMVRLYYRDSERRGLHIARSVGGPARLSYLGLLSEILSRPGYWPRSESSRLLTSLLPTQSLPNQRSQERVH